MIKSARAQRARASQRLEGRRGSKVGRVTRASRG
jgi:hypothetical protein